MSTWERGLWLIISVVPGRACCIGIADVPAGAFTLAYQVMSASKTLLHVNISTMKQRVTGKCIPGHNRHHWYTLCSHKNNKTKRNNKIKKLRQGHKTYGVDKHSWGAKTLQVQWPQRWVVANQETHTGHVLKTGKFSVLTIACTPTGVSPLPCSNKYSLLETATLKNKFTGHGSYPQLLGTFSFVNLIFFN